MLQNYLTVGRVWRICEKSFPILAIIATVTALIGLTWALFFAPADYQQSDAARIMYVHVPSAWMSMFCYSFMAAFSFGYLVWRNPVCYLVARAAAPIGAIFCGLCLVTGSIWGYPMWGTWWSWDARMTSVLILFFLYVGYIALNDAYESEEREAKSSSVLALVGAINLPIIKFSVEWWNTLHQPASVFKVGGPSIETSMLLPLLILGLSWMAIFFLLLSLRIRTAILEKKIANLS